MNKLLSLLKWIAIYYGFTRMINFVTIRIIHTTPENFDSVYNTTSLLAFLLALACYRIERVEMVQKATTKKSKAKYFILILVTFGIILLILKRRRRGAFI